MKLLPTRSTPAAPAVSAESFPATRTAKFRASFVHVEGAAIQFGSPGCKEVLMFDSLEQQMKHNEDRISTSKGRMLRYGLYVLAGALVIAGLIYAVHLIG